MIAERIKGYLKLSDWENLQNDAADSTWAGTYGIENDGPNMLKGIFSVAATHPLALVCLPSRLCSVTPAHPNSNMM